MKGKVRVFCRLRPLNEKEMLEKERKVLMGLDEFTVEHPWKDDKAKQHMYDRVFDDSATQEDIFEDTRVSYWLVYFKLTSHMTFKFCSCFKLLYLLQPFLSWFDAVLGPISCRWVQCLHICLWSNWFWKDIYNIWIR